MTDADEGDMNREVGTIVEEGIEGEEGMIIHMDIEIGKDGMNILLGLHYLSTIETNDIHHNTPPTNDVALPRNDIPEIDRHPPNGGPCHTLEIVLPPGTPAHPVPSQRKCDSPQEQSPQRTPS